MPAIFLGARQRRNRLFQDPCRVKFLADMGVSLTTVKALRAADDDAIHLHQESLIRLPDPMITAKALAESRIVLTFDLDFGDILATAGGKVPSVIIFRLRAGTRWRRDRHYRRRGISPPPATNPAMTPELSGVIALNC